MGEANAIGVGFLGCGVVGGAAMRILSRHADEIEARAGVPLSVKRAAVRDPRRTREVPPPTAGFTAEPRDVIHDPDVRVVVEVIGGIDPAERLVQEALAAGKHVVTANKELLATRGHDLMRAAERAGVDLLFEGAVGGGIPLVRPMKESLAGDRVRRVMGIVNGTTNFILTRMSETGETFAEALAEAQRLGYSEQDPSADVDGEDAASKLAILASIAFNSRVVKDDVHREGIRRVGPEDIRAAHDLGYEVKLLAVAERHEGQVALRVHPSMVPRTHPLASVRGVFNAVFVEGEESGELMFFGRGAGAGPTGAAVVGDLVEIARNITTGGRSPGCTCYRERAVVRPPEEARVRYYVVLSVLDRPGVLSAVAGVFADQDVSIASVRQEGTGDRATLVIITHVASEGAHVRTFAGLDRLDVVKEVVSRLRVEGTGEE
ncbi:MAG TPA: homoserine dehydrogenase [Actinomycetota bacterium]|nr:homoserine dehydrogenase [Actinomycetota bacterium]